MARNDGLDEQDFYLVSLEQALKLNIAVLFDGAGLARLGLEQAGHTCTGYEIDPAKHYLSQMVGSGNCILADARDVDLSGYDAVWASPPCQKRSRMNTSPGEMARSLYHDYDDLLSWSLALSHKILWVENVIEVDGYNMWGRRYNAAQFESIPRQNRQRIIGGRHRDPSVWRQYKPSYLADGWDICPAITSSYRSTGRDSTAWSWYGRRLSPREAAYHQGFEIPEGLLRSWWYRLPGYGDYAWRSLLYEAIGNGVPVYMARAFGEAYSKPEKGIRQLRLPLFEAA